MARLFEKLMYSSRWIMAPIYLGLSLVLSAFAMGYLDKITRSK